MKIFTAEQMRAFDKAATDDFSLPSIVLMENAALRVVEFLEAKFAPLDGKSIVVLCGKGNNGGDGLAVARHLEAAGVAVTVIMAARDDYKGDALTNMQARGKFSPYQWSRADIDQILNAFLPVIRRADIVVEALLGTGFSGDVREPLRTLLLATQNVPVRIAVDVPGGLHADDGTMGLDIKPATHTVTFAAPKRGFFVRDGLEQVGEVWVGTIGTSTGQENLTETGCEVLGLDAAKALLPTRPLDAHKGDAGRVLITGGSFGMSGAMALACRAALASGVGLCLAALPDKALGLFAPACIEATSRPLASDDLGRLVAEAADDLHELWEGVQAVALGPGLGRTEEALEFARRVVRECPHPLVIDADALHALPSIAHQVQGRQAPTILTPHPGEMGTLMGISAQDVNNDRYSVAARCAGLYGAYVVLKGAHSIIARPDGQLFVNLSGNPGMASGGSGDVLTGTIAGLLAQLKDAEAAAKLGVYLHGYAGDIAYRTRGNGLVASEIAANLPLALEEIAARQPDRINGRLRKLE